MVTPSDQLSIAYFLQMVFIIAFASMLFSWFVCSLFLLDFFYVSKHPFSGSADGFDSPLIRRSMTGLPFLLRELFSPPLLTVMVYKTSASSLAKSASCPDMAGNMN